MICSMSTDTLSPLDVFHLNMLREAPVWRRLALARSLVQMTYQLSWDGFCRRFHGASFEHQRYEWLKLCYGDDLAARVASTPH